MDVPHLLAAVRYVALNPVVARLVRHAEDWPWSRARAHLAGEDDERRRWRHCARWSPILLRFSAHRPTLR
jgi:hypothetical protein